ncbi:type 2 periplasmic-binding domain-containing protein [Ureaplasma canigenitalium]|uniref:hypothetical protein n=1 Tax=Ureaplasma canigenitalium TaxID=42092 RepID=UPI00068C0585|nr:hypothetical protein [Ureaplasma canigenitalium]
MKKKLNKKALFLSLGLLLPTSVILSSCTTTNKLVVGNYDGYMSEEIITEASEQFNKNNLSFNYHDNNEVVAGFLQSRVLDTVVVSSYEVVKLAKLGLVKKINWASFNLINPTTNKVIKDVAELENIYTPEVWNMIAAYDVELGDIDKDGKPDRLIEYMVPYFFQDLIFAYRGKEIKELSKPDVTWTDVLKYINENNPDNRFRFDNETNVFLDEENDFYIEKNKSKVVMIDDARTVYDLGKILDHEGDNILKTEKENEKQIIDISKNITMITNSLKEAISDSEKNRLQNELNRLENLLTFYKANTSPNVNLPNSSTIPFIDQKFDNILNVLKDSPVNTIKLKTSSNDVLNDLSLINAVGAIAYSGDIAASFNGGEYINDEASEYLKKRTPTNENFHIVRPKNTLKALDGFVMSKFISQKNEEAALKFVDKLSFEGLNNKNEEGGSDILREDLIIHRDKSNDEINEYETSQNNETETGNIFDDTGYFYWPLRNFDYVAYTPALKSIFDFVVDKKDGYLGDNGALYELISNRIREHILDDEKIKYTTKKERQTKHKQLESLINLLINVFNFYDNGDDETEPVQEIREDLLKKTYQNYSLVYQPVGVSQPNSDEQVLLTNTIALGNTIQLDLSQFNKNIEYELVEVKKVTDDGEEIIFKKGNKDDTFIELLHIKNIENKKTNFTLNIKNPDNSSSIYHHFVQFYDTFNVPKNTESVLIVDIYRILVQHIFYNLKAEFIEQKDFNEKLRDIYKVRFDISKNDDNLIERSTNDLSVGNLKIAYLKFRDKV